VKAVLGLAVLALLAAPAPDKGKEKRKWEVCQLQVTNKTPYRALIHVDGVYWGWVNAQQTFTFKGIPQGDILAYSNTQYGEFFWGPQALKCEGTVTWTLSF
jgi:hypothetical protein